jgi:hypothetical protein
MFWTLGLAHLIADYPLQTDRLVRAKQKPAGLFVHVAIHFVVTLLLCGRQSATIWPQLLALAAAHYAIDTFKSFESRRWPHIVIRPYILDQLLHILSLYLVALWIESAYNIHLDRNWTIYAIAYLIATHVWFITERIMARHDPRYQEAVEKHRWSRQVVRALALTAFILLGQLLHLPALFAMAPFLAALVPPPYRAAFRSRMLILDLTGPLLLALFVHAFTA